MVIGAAVRLKPLLLVVGPAADAAQLSQVGQAIDVVVYEDAAEALMQTGSLRPDAVLAAADLSNVDSATLARVVTRTMGIPVVLGIGDGDGEQAARALGAGAAACVARPYRALEVLQLLRAARPETVAAIEPPLKAGALRVDPGTLEVQLYGRRAVLPPREFSLLQLLVTHADRIVTRDQIRAALWGGNERDASNTITVHIQRLRNRLGDDRHKPTIIQTVRRVGYRLVPPPLRPARSGGRVPS